MTITTNDVRDEYTASAAQTVFNYTFKIFADGQLNVYITPSGQEPNDSTDITTAYTIDPSSIGDEDGGFITLDSGTSNGDLVTIVSNIPEARTTDYQNSGDFLPDTVNADFDTVVSLVKQVEDKSNRTLAFQNSLQNATALTLPAPSAGLFMVWNGSETGLENTGVPSVVVPGDLSGTLTALKSATNLTIGDFVVTTGYNANGDGGDNTYEIVAAATGTDDGGSFIDLAGSGLQAKGLFPGGVYCEGQWGAIPGVTDITANIQAAIDYRSSGGIFIKALPGQHVISGLDFSNVIDVTYGGDSIVGWTNIEHGAYFTPTGAIADMFAYDPGSRTNARNYLQNILINCNNLANYGVNFDNFSVVGFRNVVVVDAVIDSFFLGGSNASFGADLVECYSNSPVGVGYHIQSKLVRVNTCTADGGTYSVSMSTSSGQGSVRDCNFEGASIETALIESDNNKISDNNFQAPSAASTAVRLSGSFNTITGGRMTRNGGAGSMALLIDGGNNTVGAVTMTGVETGVQLSAANNSLDGLIIDASVDAIKEVTPGGSNAITGGSIVSGAVTIANTETTITGTNGTQDRIATANASFASGNTNDYDIGVNAETLWVDTAAGAATLTGVADGVAGRKLRVFNKGANTLTIADLNVASLIENRIITPTGADIVIAAFGGGVSLEYDDAGQRWYVSGQ